MAAVGAGDRTQNHRARRDPVWRVKPDCRAIARPRVILRSVALAARDRVHQHVRDHERDVRGIVDQPMPVTAFHKYALPPVNPVVLRHEHAVQPLHAASDVRLRCEHDDVVVVAHHAVGEDDPAVAPRRNREQPQEKLGLERRVEHNALVDGTAPDVIQAVRNLRAGFTGHRPNVAWPALTEPRISCQLRVEPDARPCFGSDPWYQVSRAERALSRYASTVTRSMRTSSTGLSRASVGCASIASTTSIPSSTRPKAVCLPSSHGVASAVTMKNWLPFVFGPAFAIASVPRTIGCSLISSSNVYPGPPVPVPFGQPPWIMKLPITRWNTRPS